MEENIITSLKLVYKPLIMYYGEWEIIPLLQDISLEKKGKKLFDEFIERYYYMPLTVIFKDEELARSFNYAICSRMGVSSRNLYFSKRAFLRNVISNADDVVSAGGEAAYKEIKKAIREKKDVYRDVIKLGENSSYYNEVKGEYLSCTLDISLEEFLELCKKKYTKLLSGYNAVLDLFDKPISLDRFIKCFDPNQLYLLTAYSLLINSKKYFDEYGKLDYNLVVLDSYRNLVTDIRKSDNFYNSHIIIKGVIYTIDDLFKEYDELLARAK